MRSRDYLLGTTPEVEDRLEQDMGIKTEWRDENLRAFLELLVEEINEKTEFKLTTIPWRRYSRETTRILVKKKETDLEGVVRSVLALGWSRNRALDAGKVREAIQVLLEPQHQ